MRGAFEERRPSTRSAADHSCRPVRMSVRCSSLPLAAVGAIAAIVTECTVEIERVEASVERDRNRPHRPCGLEGACCLPEMLGVRDFLNNRDPMPTRRV